MKNGTLKFLRILTCAVAIVGFYVIGLAFAEKAAYAQLTAGTDVNTSQKAGADSECSIAKNPANKLQLFVACNTAGPGLFAARSTDGGQTWIYPDPADRTLADGDPGQGAAACCDPTLSWDSFGNLYLGYLDAPVANVVILISTDGGATFANLATFAGSVDQPTVISANTTAPGAPVAVWAVWNQGGSMVARGAPVTGLGAVGAFNPLQLIPGTANCSFGDVAIAPTGVVVQACQNPTGGQGPGTIFVNTDADGLGPGNFGAAVAATTTNVGGFDFIPPQNSRSVDSEAGLAYDSFSGTPSLPGFPGPSPTFGRLYLVYTDEVVPENNDLDIMLRFSDNNGATWSAPVRVNGDGPGNVQFLPKISSNSLSGNISVCWHDTRNSAANTAVQIFCDIATPAIAGPAFIGEALISDGSSTSTGFGVEFGDYSGLAYFQGRAHPAWADTSNSTGNNPDGVANFDAYTDTVSGGAAANEGDPHMKTVDGVHYDFQSAGEFVMLKGDGLIIQNRQTAVKTTFTPGANGYTGLATCVALNTAVAAQVGSHRVTYQPNISGVPDPSGLQLRVDGVLMALTDAGIDLGGEGRIVKTSAGGGIEITFPNGTFMVVTPGWWASQSKWYLNVNVYGSLAAQGVAGALAPGSWLPSLPDGTSLGPRPASLHDRYVVLYDTFANAWRVDDSNSLFDYAPGTSTADFTIPSWPNESPSPCDIPADPTPVPPVPPIDLPTAEMACAAILTPERKGNCVFDVMATGDFGFAETYILTERLEAGGTTIVVTDNPDPTDIGEEVAFSALVRFLAPKGTRFPRGTAQFALNGTDVGNPVVVDEQGRATWRISDLATGDHIVSAKFIPDPSGISLASSSQDETHTVSEEVTPPTGTGNNLMIWVIALAIIVIGLLVWFFRRP